MARLAKLTVTILSSKSVFAFQRKPNDLDVNRDAWRVMKQGLNVMFA